MSYILTPPNTCNDCYADITGFESLNKSEIQIFKEGHCQVNYTNGETIVKEGTQCNNVICIKEGYAKLHIQGLDNKNIIIKILKKGDFIINPGVFTSTNNISQFTVSALSNISACLMDLDAFHEVFYNNKAFATYVLNLNNNLITNLFNQVIDLSHKKMSGRVANALLYLSNSIYESHFFKIHLSRQELADLSSVSKESLLRILKDFKQDGIIKINGNHIEIVSSDKLRNISNYG
ncbi:Crp/Fnr family transcriptional regulator [Carboxylicivirga sp. RSCT41]|uniref:Crp/Fnr family transcriptional regulator n=1 Tax=Carboxylicivirga agarovorans TaxID=3417570 RepID=UPI003D327492